MEEGGETYFNRLKLGIKPKLGRALVWPSVLNDDPESWDPRMFHEAKDVIKGIKYAANHWIHLNGECEMVAVADSLARSLTQITQITHLSRLCLTIFFVFVYRLYHTQYLGMYRKL